MIFSLRDAILLSGLLWNPFAPDFGKTQLAIMEADDVDAFGEIMNQVIGSFNSVFKSSPPEKIHLKLNAPKKFIPALMKCLMTNLLSMTNTFCSVPR